MGGSGEGGRGGVGAGAGEAVRLAEVAWTGHAGLAAHAKLAREKLDD